MTYRYVVYLCIVATAAVAAALIAIRIITAPPPPFTSLLPATVTAKPSGPRMLIIGSWVTHPTIVLPTAAPVQTSTPTH